MIDDVVFLADQLVGLLFILDHRAAHLCILTLQLFAGKVLDDAGPQRVPQDVGRGPQAVTRGAQGGGGKNRKIATKAFLLKGTFESKRHDKRRRPPLPPCIMHQ